MMILSWILIGLFIYYLFNNRQVTTKSEDSLSRLKERFVNGEVDEETYLRMKKLIE